jgi:hypothetical protein
MQMKAENNLNNLVKHLEKELLYKLIMQII